MYYRRFHFQLRKIIRYSCWTMIMQMRAERIFGAYLRRILDDVLERKWRPIEFILLLLLVIIVNSCSRFICHTVYIANFLAFRWFDWSILILVSFYVKCIDWLLNRSTLDIYGRPCQQESLMNNWLLLVLMVSDNQLH